MGTIEPEEITTPEIKDIKEKTKQQHLTREQRRKMERTNSDAKQVFDQLTEKFLKKIVTEEQTEEQVKEYMSELSKKWRLYCKSKNLLPKAYTLLDDYMKGLLKQYSEIPQAE